MVRASLLTKMVDITMVTGEMALLLEKLKRCSRLMMFTSEILSTENLTDMVSVHTRTATDMLVLGRQTPLLVTVFFITVMDQFSLVTLTLTKKLMVTVSLRTVVNIGLSTRMMQSAALTRESTPMELSLKVQLVKAKSMDKEPTPSQTVLFGKVSLLMIFSKEMVSRLKMVNAIELSSRTIVLNLSVLKSLKTLTEEDLRLPHAGTKENLLMEKPTDKVLSFTLLVNSKATGMMVKCPTMFSMDKVPILIRLVGTRRSTSVSSKMDSRPVGAR